MRAIIELVMMHKIVIFIAGFIDESNTDKKTKIKLMAIIIVAAIL